MCGKRSSNYKDQCTLRPKSTEKKKMQPEEQTKKTQHALRNLKDNTNLLLCVSLL